MSGDQFPSLPDRKRRQMPGVCPGGMLKLRFDWYISTGLEIPKALTWEKRSHRITVVQQKVLGLIVSEVKMLNSCFPRAKAI